MHFACRSRHGIQLLELTIAMSIGSILLAGMASAIFLSSRAATLATTRETAKAESDEGLTRLRREIELASSIDEAGADSIRLRLSTPSGVETVHHYKWDGAGNPLRLSIDGGDEFAVTPALDEFGVTWNRTKPTAVFQGYAPSDHFKFISHTFAHSPMLSGNGATLDLPTTYQTGDLLVAVVSIASNVSSSLSANSGWIQCLRVRFGSHITLGIYYSEGSPSDFSPSWSFNAASTLCVAHFKKPHDLPVQVTETWSASQSEYAECPGVTVSGGSGLVIRAMGIEAGATTYLSNFAGMPGFNVVVCKTDVFEPGLGLVFANSEGRIRDGVFDLRSSGKNATATIVFQQ